MTRFSPAAAALKTVGLAAALWLAPLAPLSAADAAKDKRQDTAVAKVDGQIIMLSEVADAFARVPPQYQQLPLPTLFSAIVDNLINTKLAAAAARKDGLDALPEVKEQMSRVESEILQRAYISHAIDERLTDDAVHQRYDSIANNLQGEEQVSARHILVDSETQAKDIIAQLNKNANFTELARQYSKGPSKDKAGDLGYFTRESMVPEFANAAFALKEGEYTKAPVKTQFGWHVIKVEGRRFADPPTFEEMRPKLENDMAQEIGRRAVEDLRQASKIERFEVDPETVGNMLAPR